MLPSLHIEGFRCFRALTIERLGRVNLVVGKNNVGKTTLLDALRVHAAGASALAELQEMLDRRGEIVRTRKGTTSTSLRLVDWARVFHQGSPAIGPLKLSIGAIGNESDTLGVRLESDGRAITGMLQGRLILVAQDGTDSVRLHEPLPAVSRRARMLVPYQHIPSWGLPADESSLLWDDVVLTEHEETCLQALRIIAPDIQRVALLDVPGPQGRLERAAHVSRASQRQPEPLRSLGEGMNRLFDITLGMVNARGGRLLIDEIENGLHYSIHEELWRYVFQIASMLDVQVFATTHSWGCIEAFQAAEREHPGDGILIRLERRNDETRAFVFGEDKLAVVAEQGVEVR